MAMTAEREASWRMPPPFPGNFVPALPEHDAVPAEQSPPAAPEIAGFVIAIDYVDADDNESRRRITLSTVKDGKVYAYCHERAALRCFVLAQIEAVIDWQTGEVHEDPAAYFAWLIASAGGDLGALVRQRRAVSTGQRLAASRCRDGVRVLAYLAWCDGRAHPDEREAIARYCDDLCHDILGADLAAIVDWGIRLRPDWQATGRALSRVVADERECRALRRRVRDLIAADDAISPEEIVVGGEILKLLDGSPEALRAEFFGDQAVEDDAG